MNTHYTVNLTQTQFNLLTVMSKSNGWEDIEQALNEAQKQQKHPNIEDVYQHEADHSGFNRGEKVLLECTVVATSDHVSTLSVRHLAAVKGEEIMVANNLIYHKEP